MLVKPQHLQTLWKASEINRKVHQMATSLLLVQGTMGGDDSYLSSFPSFQQRNGRQRLSNINPFCEAPNVDSSLPDEQKCSIRLVSILVSAKLLISPSELRISQ